MEVPFTGIILFFRLPAITTGQMLHLLLNLQLISRRQEELTSQSQKQVLTVLMEKFLQLFLMILTRRKTIPLYCFLEGRTLLVILSVLSYQILLIKTILTLLLIWGLVFPSVTRIAGVARSVMLT